ncbi:hypothetical protein EUX98_g9316 [Antrodiella citrinella]|uniref:Uncharacterized protein n=1 Tax=Antrodiella citrinella TaxID=2447956 RepID=A0A4S4LV63_9APHY|nr:hypothetical protein EUX98_g9316 [Antrodiella citrinella]
MDRVNTSASSSRQNVQQQPEDTVGEAILNEPKGKFPFHLLRYKTAQSVVRDLGLKYSGKSVAQNREILRVVDKEGYGSSSGDETDDDGSDKKMHPAKRGPGRPRKIVSQSRPESMGPRRRGPGRPRKQVEMPEAGPSNVRGERVADVDVDSDAEVLSGPSSTQRPGKRMRPGNSIVLDSDSNVFVGVAPSAKRSRARQSQNVDHNDAIAGPYNLPAGSKIGPPKKHYNLPAGSKIGPPKKHYNLPAGSKIGPPKKHTPKAVAAAAPALRSIPAASPPPPPRASRSHAKFKPSRHFDKGKGKQGE